MLYPDSWQVQIEDVKRSAITKLLGKVEKDRGSQAAHSLLALVSVYGLPRRPSDSDLLIPSIERHQELLGRVPLGRGA